MVKDKTSHDYVFHALDHQVSFFKNLQTESELSKSAQIWIEVYYQNTMNCFIFNSIISLLG